MVVTSYSPLPYMAAAVCSFSGVQTVGRPPRRPRARATASSASVRSRIRSRSNSGQRAEDAEDETATRSGGVQVLGEAAHCDASLLQSAEDADQMSE